jgi:hypothetical protein
MTKGLNHQLLNTDSLPFCDVQKLDKIIIGFAENILCK